MPKKMQPAVRTLSYNIETNGITDTYIDLAKDLSMVNRRLYEQGRQYFVHSVEFQFIAASATFDTYQVVAQTAGDSWMVHNAHTKGKALWHEMNKLVLDDNPSVEGKWADYKVYLDDHMRTGTIAIPVDGDGNAYTAGEWDVSDYVLPQHVVDPVTGQPLAADQCQAHLVGPNVGVAPNFISVGLVNSYQESRARVQIAPDTDADLATGFFSLLTDSGSQEPELATVISQENDSPPYDIDNFPGGDTNADCTVAVETGVASATFPNGMLSGFSAECGLIKFTTAPFLDGTVVTTEQHVLLRVNLMPGDYKGVAALPMGQ